MDQSYTHSQIFQQRVAEPPKDQHVPGLSEEHDSELESLGPRFFSRVSKKQGDAKTKSIYDTYHIYLSATGLAYLDDLSGEAHQLTNVGFAAVSIMKTGFPDSENVEKSCKIEQLGVETGNILTKMEASITMLRRLQSFCVQHNAEGLTIAYALGSCWFPGLLEPAGFKLCDCKRVQTQGFHYCMALPTPPIESPVRIKEEPFDPNTVDRTVATMDAKSRANAVASESGEERISILAPGSGLGSGLVHTPTPSEQSGEQTGQESEAPIQSSTLRNPFPPRYQGTGISRPESQEATDTDGMIAQDLTNDTAEKTTAYGTIAIRSRPAAKMANHKIYCSHWIRTGECDYMQSGCKYKHEMPVDKETLQKIARPAAKMANHKIYCSHWIRTGECDYMQSGCKYKHEMPVDKETLQNCGFREIPRWFKESPEYEDYLEKTGGSAIRRLTGVSAAEEEVTSAAKSSHQSSGRWGESDRLPGAGRTLLTPTPWRDTRQVVSHPMRSPYYNYHQRIVTPQPDATSTRSSPPSAANPNVTDRARFRQLERQTYKPAGATASGGSSKVKHEDVEHLPRRQARNNSGSGIAAGNPHLRQLQQALRGSRPAGSSVGSMVGTRTKRQRSSPEPDVDSKRARRERAVASSWF